MSRAARLVSPLTAISVVRCTLKNGAPAGLRAPCSKGLPSRRGEAQDLRKCPPDLDQDTGSAERGAAISYPGDARVVGKLPDGRQPTDAAAALSIAATERHHRVSAHQTDTPAGPGPRLCLSECIELPNLPGFVSQERSPSTTLSSPAASPAVLRPSFFVVRPFYIAAQSSLAVARFGLPACGQGVLTRPGAWVLSTPAIRARD